MNKVIVLHDRYSNEPVVIRISAIDAVRKNFDRVENTVEEYTEILIGTVMMKIRNAESEE